MIHHRYIAPSHSPDVAPTGPDCKVGGSPCCMHSSNHHALQMRPIIMRPIVIEQEWIEYIQKQCLHGPKIPVGWPTHHESSKHEDAGRKTWMSTDWS